MRVGLSVHDAHFFQTRYAYTFKGEVGSGLPRTFLGYMYLKGRYQWLGLDMVQIIIKRDFAIDASFKSYGVILLTVRSYVGTAATFRALFRQQSLLRVLKG